MKQQMDFDSIIIGSGAGGSPAASILAQAGKRIAIVEKSTLGGESPNWGDVPTGALLYATSLYTRAKAAGKFGLRTAAVGYNYNALLAWRDIVTQRTGASDNRRYYEDQGIQVVSGEAQFHGPRQLCVQSPDGELNLTARSFLLATGSEWAVPNVPGVDDTPLHTPQTILSLPRPPKSLLIIGSSLTAIEYASLFATFGTRVSICETANRILPEFDQEVGQLISQELAARGVTIATNTTIAAMHHTSLLQQTVTMSNAGQQHDLTTEAILIASERVPATDELALERAGVRYDAYGISVNEYLQTSAKHIFAAGGVVATDAQTHEVVLHSQTAAHNMLHRAPKALDEHPLLMVGFSDPQIAHTGLSEDDCLRRDLKIKTALTPLTLTSRSNLTDQRTGFVKLISDKKGILLGGTIVAPQASNMIAQLSLAVRYRLTAQQLASTPHCFTAWSEAIRIAASQLL